MEQHYPQSWLVSDIQLLLFYSLHRCEVPFIASWIPFWSTRTWIKNSPMVDALFFNPVFQFLSFLLILRNIFGSIECLVLSSDMKIDQHFKFWETVSTCILSFSITLELIAREAEHDILGFKTESCSICGMFILLPKSFAPYICLSMIGSPYQVNNFFYIRMKTFLSRNWQFALRALVH